MMVILFSFNQIASIPCWALWASTSSQWFLESLAKEDSRLRYQVVSLSLAISLPLAGSKAIMFLFPCMSADNVGLCIALESVSTWGNSNLNFHISKESLLSFFFFIMVYFLITNPWRYRPEKLCRRKASFLNQKVLGNSLDLFALCNWKYYISLQLLLSIFQDYLSYMKLHASPYWVSALAVSGESCFLYLQLLRVQLFWTVQ